jgi:hypothetical protein
MRNERERSRATVAGAVPEPELSDCPVEPGRGHPVTSALVSDRRGGVRPSMGRQLYDPRRSISIASVRSEWCYFLGLGVAGLREFLCFSLDPAEVAS